MKQYGAEYNVSNDDVTLLFFKNETIKSIQFSLLSSYQ